MQRRKRTREQKLDPKRARQQGMQHWERSEYE